MVEAIGIELGGEPLRLLADRAVHWPARRRLLLADLHLGKADTFRAAGIALPRGGTGHDLARLSALVEANRIESVWILGDVLHGRADLSHWRASWQAFRERHRTLQVAALAGNHDRRLRDAGLGIDLLGDAVHDAPFLLRHAPAVEAGVHVLSGHLHPVLKLPGEPRAPVFWLRPGCMVLPAFSAFTGGFPISLAPGESAIACNGEALLRINASGPPRC